jgi:sugar phosphate isomerase/epimerase
MHQDIRIGTLVQGANNPVEYIKQILPYGFESFSITFWQTLNGTDLKKLAEKVTETLSGTGAVISSIGVFGNPLETGEKDIETLKGLEQAIDAAPLFGTDIVTGFTGRLRGKPIDESIDRFKAVWTPLAERAKNNNVRIAFENCDMGGTWSSGDWNIAHNPTAWEMMFNAVPHDNLGLEWEPCHQMVSLIDPLPQLREWIDKIFHVHGKDATIHWDVVRKYGIHGPQKFAFHRTPGFGDTNWTDVISELRRGGFSGSIDIEGWHDPVYKGELEMTGQVHALNYLKQCRGGKFIPNPDV